MSRAKLNLYDFPQQKLAELIADWGFARVHAATVWKYLYRNLVSDVLQMRELPRKLCERLLAEAVAGELGAARVERSADGLTRKYLLGLHDGRTIETVLMQQRGRYTACLSSQVGCALGCTFCATGQTGFSRNLSAGEIVAQAVYCAEKIHLTRLRSIVLMGMGEPLLNYDDVMDALEILSDPAGFAIGHKQITISTVGVIPGIVRLADEGRPYSLAVSLHAATQQERERIVPAARTWPLDGLLDSCHYYAHKLKRRIFFEWTLIEGENDSFEHAHDLANLLKDIPTQVNLIPLNPTARFAGRPTAARAADRFREILQEYGLPVSIRQRRGIEIAAGCGQLAGAAQGAPLAGSFS